MKRLILLLAVLPSSLLSPAMPTEREIAEVKPLVAELMKPDTDAMKAGRKSKVDVAKSAMLLIVKADTPAAKLLLARGAFQNFVKGGDYDAAEKALDVLLKAVPDYPADEQQELIEKALHTVPSKKAPQLRARLAEVKQKANLSMQIKKVKALLEKSPDDPALNLRLATAYALQDDWPHAVPAFAKSSSAVLANAAKAELDPDHPPAKTADLWWSVELPKSSDGLTSALRSHAATLYSRALPSLSGLQKVQAERRIHEAQSVASSDKISAKSYVQNGMVAQWDAIENAGYGIHGECLTEWINLKGSKNIILTKSASFTADALVCDGKCFAGSIKDFLPSTKIVSADIVFELDSVHGNSCLFSTGTHRDYYDRCFGVVGGGTKLVFSNYIIGPVTKGRHSYHLDFLTGGYSLDGVNGAASAKGTLDASPKRGYEFYVGGFKDSAINCKLHAIRFYGKKLTDEEIKKNYLFDKTRFGL